MDGAPFSTQTEVVIVGGGPVGLCLALELGRQGVDCVLLEQRDAGATPFPTANHISIRTMEHLRRLGLADEVGQAFRPDWGGDWMVLTHLGGDEVARVEHALACEPNRFSPEREVWAPKPSFDPIIERAARSCPSVDLRHGVQVVGVEQDDDQVWCHSVDQSGASTVVTARYLVACDGANSTARRLLGIELDGPEPLPMRINSAFFRSQRVAELVPPGGVQYQILGEPAGPTPTPFGAGVMVAVDGFALWRLHGVGLDAADGSVTVARLRELGAIDAEVLAMTAWTPRQGLSRSFHDRRVFLAGDAAHIVTPFGGLGVNTGMADAFDLGWKLSATIGGWGGPRLLDSYQPERRQAALDLLAYQGADFSSGVPEMVTPPIPLGPPPDPKLWNRGAEGEAARRTYGASMIDDRVDEFDKPAIDLGYRYDGSPVIVADGLVPVAPSNPQDYRPTSHPGGRAPHVDLRPGSTLDSFGSGFCLLRTRPDVSVARLMDGAADERLPLSLVTEPAAAEAYLKALTLVRPDGFVAWHGDACPTDSVGVLRVVCGRSGPNDSGP